MVSLISREAHFIPRTTAMLLFIPFAVRASRCRHQRATFASAPHRASVSPLHQLEKTMPYYQVNTVSVDLQAGNLEASVNGFACV
jgi:hypothetical protein